MTPRAVFTQNSPPAGFRRISDVDLDFATAQRFENERIELGGIIELRDGTRYSNDLLITIVGQKHEMVRLRHDHSFISVLPAHKGEEIIIAARRVRVGKDADEVSKANEHLNHLRKLVDAVTTPLEYEPGAQFAEAAPPTPPVQPSALPPAPEQEISSVAYFMEGDGKNLKKPMTFADLED